MNENVRSFFAQSAILLLLLLFASACSDTSSTQASEPLNQTVSPAGELTPPQEPSELSSSAMLTSFVGEVTVLGEGNSEKVLDQNETIVIPVGERVKLDAAGRGALRFQGGNEVELFGGSDVRLDEAKLESGGSIFIRLKQNAGHSHVFLDEKMVARLALATDDSTVTTLEQGTEFTVCFAPEKLTCVLVQKGSAEVTSKNEKLILRKGEATYYEPGQPPVAVICARMEEFEKWLGEIRGPGEVGGLGALVASWPQEPCSYAASEIPAVDTSLPSSEGMLRVEGGNYLVGSAQPDDFHSAQQEVPLEAFWIDAYEVTNAQYQEYLQASGQAPPAVPPGQEGHPAKGISWEQAAAYCAWLNKRLPTEAEWETAGRGSGANPPVFPWGNDPGAGGAVDSLPRTETYQVGTAAFNVSPFGVYDLVGNVWEWVAEPYAPVAEGHQVLRGGRHGLLRDLAYRQTAEPNDERFIPFTGFRCTAGSVQGE
jgi:formylglycine-generating enzyme required for sulfatase activity